ncbi:phosphopantetheine-binding protein [Micromonospora sp. FIMYZ51]|uniref:acyl carrier protein n=1 Tax=Micromonospora sp. FIMYZ51 TaxID=3051832 RepID=UPI00311D60B9
MWDDQFESLLRQYLPFISPDEKLEADSDLRDLGLDSMGMVELLRALEQEYDVRFTDDLLSTDTFRTPGVLAEALSSVRAAAV